MSANVFKYDWSQTLSFVKELIAGQTSDLTGHEKMSKPFPKQALVFTVSSTSLFKKCGKKEIVRNEQFLLFPQCFLPSW